MSIGWGGGAEPGGPANGDLAGTYPGPTVAGLQGRALSAVAPTTDQRLVWDGAAWVPTDALFGEGVTSNYNLVPQTTSNPPGSALSYLTLGTIGSPITLDPAGRYIAIITVVAQVSAANTVFWADVYVNDLPSATGPIAVPFGKADAQDAVTLTSVLDASLLPPTIYLDLRVAKDSGTGSITVKQATVALWRLS